VLCRPEAVADVQATVFATTSTIGLRVVPVGKVALERASASVEVLGGRVGVKVAVSGGRVVNVSVEYEDVAALARETGVPVKEALRAATAAAEAAYPVTTP
jgi:pyridinium-3,5-bisthiocarboxylic acid mononucleotide nickel chelatase